MNTIKRALFVVMVLGALILSQIIQSGYIMYKVVSQDNNIQETIIAIKEDDKYISIDQISETFLDAIVSVEDQRFYEHKGYDLISISRAFLTNISSGKIVSGGSTITQQLAKNLFLSFEKKFDRKVAEVFIAKELEACYSKEEILELYVNVINFGEGNIGIASASNHYFDKTPLELNSAEAVILAGIPQSPGRFSLTYNKDRAINRSNQVVRAMLDNETISFLDSIKIIYSIREGN